MQPTPRAATTAAMFLFSFGLVLFELLLTRLFGVVLFASYAHLALALALLGISVGALAQHLWPSLVPDEGLEERLAWLSLLMAATTLFAVVFTVVVPVTVQFEEPPADYGERSQLSWALIDPVWFSVLLPVLASPFTLAGLAFAGAFQRRKEHIGLLYGADLIGGAAAAVVFVPLLYTLPGPDAGFVVALSGAISATLLFWSKGLNRLAAACAVPVLVSALLIGISASGVNLIKVRFAAGYSEDNVTYTRWTPLTRLAVHVDKRGAFMLLDNTSASEIVLDEHRRAQIALEPNRGLVYRITDPPAQVAVLAASAGPEVAIAQSFGFTGIEAVDIAPEIGDVVAEQYPDNKVNPYVNGDTRRVTLDGRAAILHSPHDFDIIQMVHANLHSSAGQLSNAWSPALLESREAFETYFSRLTPDGTLSFGRGSRTKWILRSAIAALEEMGIEHPERNVVWVAGAAQVMLAKTRPWTPTEMERVRKATAMRESQFVRYDPTQPDPKVWDEVMRVPVLTDDRPYLETPEDVVSGLEKALAHFVGISDDTVAPTAILYHSLLLQVAFVLVVGALCLAIPALRRARDGSATIRGAGWGLAYVSCLGYGYLAVETVLLHHLVLFVGHPTYAITVVILAMLLFSGIGSVVVQRVPDDRLTTVLRGALALVVVLGALQAFVIPPILYATAFGLPLAARSLIVAVVLAPLGFVMGVPFPLALRILRPEAAGMVPWAWALNGWMSVVASLGTVLVSRLLGYQVAFAVALAAYVLALALAGRLAGIGAPATQSAR